jgi:hypothetical protein
MQLQAALFFSLKFVMSASPGKDTISKMITDKNANLPKKSAILKANTEPIKAPYNDPLVCKRHQASMCELIFKINIQLQQLTNDS